MRDAGRYNQAVCLLSVWLGTSPSATDFATPPERGQAPALHSSACATS